MLEKITPAELFSNVRGTETYRLYQQRAGEIEKTGTQEEVVEARSRAIGNSILSLADVESPAKSALYTMMSHVDSFADARDKLEYADQHSERDYASRKPYLHEVIEFNHSLKTAIDLNPSLGFNETAYLMANVRGASHGSEEAKRFYGKIKPILNGMRHEIGAAQVIDATGEYEVDYDRLVTVEDDSHGIDVWVRRIGDDTSFGVDVKASEFTAERKLMENGYKNVVWSHCTDGDFNDSFRVPFEVARRSADDMRRDLRRIYPKIYKTANA